jgi:hypothetical protein
MYLVIRKRHGPKGNSGWKPQEDSKEILWNNEKAERHRPCLRTPARKHAFIEDSEEEGPAWEVLNKQQKAG